MTAHKDVLVEIHPMPPPGTRLQFINLGTSSPRLELEDGTVYVGQFEDMLGSVLVFKETSVFEQATEADEHADEGAVGLHGAMMARLEEAQAREEGGVQGAGSAGGQDGREAPRGVDGATGAAGGVKGKQKAPVNVSTATELEGVANVKLVFSLLKK